MKVALCLSGHLRDFEKTFPSLSHHIISKTNCDIFIHTWDKLGYFNNFRPDRGDLYNGDIDNKLELIKKLYQPKSLVIQPSDEISSFIEEANRYLPHFTQQPKHPGHMIAMLYKIKACNQLRKEYEAQNNIEYDIVIRSRPDLYFTSSININTFNAISDLYVPNIECYSGINDQFSYSNSHYMDLYSKFYDTIGHYFFGGGVYVPEQFVKWYFYVMGISYKFSEIKYHIYR